MENSSRISHWAPAIYCMSASAPNDRMLAVSTPYNMRGLLLYGHQLSALAKFVVCNSLSQSIFISHICWKPSLGERMIFHFSIV